MRLQTYEQVVLRDRPTYWWRLQAARTTALLPSAVYGPESALLSESSVQPASAGGLPGAGVPVAGRLVGDNGTNANNDGWFRNSFPFIQTDYVAFELWVFVRSGLTASRVYTLMHRTTNSAATNVGMYISGTGKLQAVSTTTINSDESFRVNAWNHCVVNFYIPSGFPQSQPTEVFLNGQYKRGAGNGNGQNICLNTLQFAIGRPNFNTIQSPPANLADAAVYNYRLTQHQVLEHYHAGLGVRRRTAPLATMALFGDAPEPPPPPPPGGLTPITEGLPNRRVLLVSDRPR